MQLSKVAVFTAPGQPIEIIEQEVRPPAPDEILVRVSIAGVCGSDVHRLKGDLPANKSKGVCFGHEAVGVVEDIGAEVSTDSAGTALGKGDSVYWMPLAPCRDCWDSGISNPLQCHDINWPPPAGEPSGACFRQYATLKKNCVFIRVPEGLPFDNIIAFGCGMPTAVRGFKQLGAITPGVDVVIQGSGPVGLACTLLASLAGARSVIVIGDPTHRLEAAASLGATCTIPLTGTTPASRLEQVRALTAGLGAHIVVEAAGVAAAFPEGLDLLRMDGRYLILGLYSGKATVPIDPVRINNYNLHIIGSLGIDVESYSRTVNIAAEHGTRLQFPEFVTHRFPLDQLEEAINLVGQGIPIKAAILPHGIVE